MEHMPRNVSKRIMKACRKGEAFVVVPVGQKPSRIFSLEKYLKMKELPKTVRPWTGRRTGRQRPDPLQAVEGKVLEPIRRKNLYEET